MTFHSPVRSLLKTLIVLVALLLQTFVATDCQAQTELWATDTTGNWNVDGNWLDGSKPLPGADVALNVIGDDYRVDLFGNAEVDDLAISSTNATVFTNSIGGLLTLSGTGDLEIFAGKLQSSGSYSLDFSNGITNHGGTLQSSGHAATQVHNGLNNAALGHVRVFGARNSQGSATFGADLQVVSGGFDNSGLITLETTTALSGGVFAQLSVTGTLNNSGTIDSLPFLGGGQGARRIAADSLVNSGTIINHDVAPLDLQASNATYFNSGTINAAVGEVRFRSIASLENQATGNLIGTNMLIDGSSNNSSTASNAGTINLSGNLQLNDLVSFDNSGDIHAGGNVSMSFRTFHHRDGASLSGGNQLAFTSATLDLENGFTTDFTDVRLNGSTIQGAGTYVSQSGTSTAIVGATVNSGVHWQNEGLVYLSGLNTVSASINSGFTNEVGGELRIRGTRSNAGFISAGAKLNMAGGLTNKGTLSFETSRGGGPSPIANLILSGTLNNSGLIDSRLFEGSAPGVKTIQADTFINSGVFQQNDTGIFRFSRSGAAYTNSGLFNINAGEVRFQNIATFSNSGEINLAAMTELELASGTSFVNEIGGSILGEGIVNSRLASFLDHGTLGPGSSPGVLTMQVNNYVQSNSGVLGLGDRRTDGRNRVRSDLIHREFSDPQRHPAFDLY